MTWVISQYSSWVKHGIGAFTSTVGPRLIATVDIGAIEGHRCRYLYLVVSPATTRGC